VLALNEVWNIAFFGRRSTRDAFLGSLVFAVPLIALQKAVGDDRVATVALAPYTAWSLVYDVPWSYRLWGLNPTLHADDAARHSPRGRSPRRRFLNPPFTGTPHRVRSYGGPSSPCSSRVMVRRSCSCTVRSFRRRRRRRRGR